MLAGATLGWLRSGDVARTAARPLPWDRQVEADTPARNPLERTRGWLSERLASCPPRTGRLARALVLGERLPRGLRETYSRAGVVHLVSQSGLHVGLVFGLVLGLLGPRLGSRAPGAGILVAAAYAALAGGRPAAWRAVLMVTIVAVARRRGLEPDPRGVVALAAATFLIGCPRLVGDAGALLSFAAAFGIVHLDELLGAWVPYRGPGHELLRASLAAWLATAPILAWLGVPLAPLAPLTNLLAVPLGVFLTSYGLGLVALAALTPEAAALAAPPFEVGAWLLDTIAELAATAPALGGIHLPPVAAGALGLALYHAGATAVAGAFGSDPSSAPRAEGPSGGALGREQLGEPSGHPQAASSSLS